MNQKPIVLALHEPHFSDKVPVGLCCFCDEPVYFSQKGEAGELSIDGLKDLSNPKFIGAECIGHVFSMIGKIMSTKK